MQRTSASLRPAVRQAAARRQLAYKPVRRSYATAAPAQSSASSHLAAGAAGGAVAFLGVYAYYHYSGAAKAVQSAQSIAQTATDLKEKAKQATPSPKAMLGFIRSAAHSYSSAFPGAAWLVDQTFDQIDTIAEKHGPEVEKIVKDVYNDISKAAAQGGDKASDQIMAAVQEAVNKLQKLGGQFTANTLQPILEKNPQLKDAVNDSLTQISQFGDKYGPEAKKIADDTVKQIQDLAAAGLTAGSIAKASSLAKQKLAEIQELAQKAGSEAYSKAADGARPYLDKAPEVKKYLESQIEGLKEYVGDDGVKLINDTYADLEKAGKKGDTKALAEIVKERMGQLQKLAKDKGGDLASKAAEKAQNIPGVDKLFESVPNLKDIHELRQLAKEKGGKFEELLNSTYEDVKKVLEQRAKEAKDLSQDAGKDAKKQVGK